MTVVTTVCHFSTNELLSANEPLRNKILPKRNSICKISSKSRQVTNLANDFLLMHLYDVRPAQKYRLKGFLTIRALVGLVVVVDDDVPLQESCSDKFLVALLAGIVLYVVVEI